MYILLLIYLNNYIFKMINLKEKQLMILNRPKSVRLKIVISRNCCGLFLVQILIISKEHDWDFFDCTTKEHDWDFFDCTTRTSCIGMCYVQSLAESSTVSDLKPA